MSSIIWIIIIFISIVQSKANKDISNSNPNYFTSYHFEWNNPSQWLTNSDNGDIISCVSTFPSLCIYAIPNQPSFQLFYNELMFDFLNDDHWSKVNIIENVIDNVIDSQKHRRRLRRRKRKRRKRRKRKRKRRRKRRRRNFLYSGPFSYGCFNALCTTVLGPPQIIGPPIPRRKRRRSNYKKCDRCGNKKYPGFIYTGGPGIMGPMGGLTPLMGGGMRGMAGMGGMGGMMQGMGMGGMGMGGMGMGGMMQGMGMSGMGGMGGASMGKPQTIHVVTHEGDAQKEGDAQNQLEKQVKKAHKAAKKATKQVAKKAKKGKLKQAGTKVVKSSKKKKRRLLDESQLKIIEKCIIIKDKYICLTYYYIDKSITLDYSINIAKNKLSNNNNKYYQTSQWIWNINGEFNCNDKLLSHKGEICVNNMDNSISIKIGNDESHETITLDADAIALDKTNWSASAADIYNTLCQNIFIEKAKLNICVEILDKDKDKHINEIKISVETPLE